MKSHWIAMELEQRGDPLGQNFRIFQQLAEKSNFVI